MKRKFKQGQPVVKPLIDKTVANENNERYCNLMVNEIPYRMQFEPFFFNDQVRYYVCINGGPKDKFVWDTNAGMFRAIDDKAGVLPLGLEKAISEKLQTQI